MIPSPQASKDTYIGAVADLLNRGLVESTSIPFEGAVVDNLDTVKAITLSKTALVDIVGPDDLGLDVGVGDVLLERDNVAALDDIAAVSRGADRDGGDRGEQGRGGDGESLEIKHGGKRQSRVK